MAPPSDDALEIPKQPIDRIVGPFERFMHVEAAGGIVLFAAALVALVLASSPWADGYRSFWHTEVAFALGGFELRHSLQHWVSDGLMAIFFFVIGLEVKRELVAGELSDLRNAVLPIAAALGGMLVPALVYLSLQPGAAASRGWGIPMATDIAFVVGCMAILGRRVPSSLRIFLVSLAIVDDIGAILVIALGYTAHIDVTMLLLGAGGIVLISVLARLGVRALLVYTAMGVFVWVTFHASGVHATVAGVILGLQTPAQGLVSETLLTRSVQRAAELLHGGGWGDLEHRAHAVRRFRWRLREAVSPAEYLEALLHPWTTFVILPLFALANAAVPLHASAFADPLALAVTAALVLGKPLGIVGFAWLAVRLRLARLPPPLGWASLAGAGALAGIGFTMSLFIAGLALAPPALDTAKVGVLAASALAALLGFGILLRTLPPAPAAR